jgi:hypothetical protein
LRFLSVNGTAQSYGAWLGSPQASCAEWKTFDWPPVDFVKRPTS